MDDGSIRDRISELVEREHHLRTARADGELDGEAEARELAAAEVELDRCWDLLRQRQAKREFGADPDEASPRSAGVVEGYWQ